MPFRSTDARLKLKKKNRLDPGPLGLCLEPVYQSLNPKPVVKEINEEGSVFSVRCKLFYKVDSEWRERGVGNLFIKPISNEKFQLLVRADTNLGNILLNLLITKDIPVKVQKNNLTLVCVPSPPLPISHSKQSEDGANVKPVPMLLRAKTEEAAMELLKQFDRHRGVPATA